MLAYTLLRCEVRNKQKVRRRLKFPPWFFSRLAALCSSCAFTPKCPLRSCGYLLLQGLAVWFKQNRRLLEN